MISKKYLSNDFKNAVKDYYYLLENDYSKKATIKLIGDRYRLTGLERSVLLRGIIKKEKALERKNKLLKEFEINNKLLVIDCYNVLMTVISYLSGKFFYIANDGFLRDAGEFHGKIGKSEGISKALTLLFKYLSNNKMERIEMYLDSPVTNSKELSKNICMLFDKYKIIGNSYVVKSADYYLIHSKDGICSTSDSTIIDHKDKIFDLSYFILKFFFNPDFFNLDRFLA